MKVSYPYGREPLSAWVVLGSIRKLRNALDGWGDSDPALLLRYVTLKTSSFRVTGWVGGGGQKFAVLALRNLRTLPYEAYEGDWGEVQFLVLGCYCVCILLLNQHDSLLNSVKHSANVATQ